MNSHSWTPLSDPLQEDEVKLELAWKANNRRLAALERQAKLNQFDNVTEYMLEVVADRLLDDEADTVQSVAGKLFCGCQPYDDDGGPRKV